MKRPSRVAGIITGLATASALVACSPAAPPDGISAIECEPAAHARDDALSVVGPESFMLAGWSHVVPNDVFAGARATAADYRIDASKYAEDATCDGVRTLGVTLVRRTYDWDMQHANGLEARFAGEGVTFGDVTDLVIEVRIRPEDTFLPTAADLRDAYGDLLTPDQLAELDGGLVNLELTLFGDRATPDHPFMNASATVELDPAAVGDGWVRVQIPRADFEWYTEENYQRTPVASDEHQDLTIAGLRINPETAGRTTVRGLLDDEGFDPAAKQDVLKEMGLTFSLVEVGLAAPGEGA